MTRYIELKEYIPVLIEILESDRDVNLPVSGSSMSPFLVSGRDTVIISKPKESFKCGNIVLFRRNNGQYIMHRIHHIDKNGGLYLIGDGERKVEGPICEEQVLGIIHKVIRKNRLIESKDLSWLFFERIWIRIIPFRPIAHSIYKIVKRIRMVR